MFWQKVWIEKQFLAKHKHVMIYSEIVPNDKIDWQKKENIWQI